MRTYTDDQIKFILKLRKGGKSLKEITKEFNSTYNENKTPKAMESLIFRYEDIDFSYDSNIQNIKQAFRDRKNKAKISKNYKEILEDSLSKEDFLSEFSKIMKETPLAVHKKQPKVPSKKKTKRAIIMHLSDTHFQAMIDEEELGGLNKYTEVEEARRLAFFTREVGEYKKKYRDETELYIVLNGDIGQGIIHDAESTPVMTTQFAAMVHLLTQSISYLSNKFKKVNVITTPGNHLRFMHKSNKGRQTVQKWDGFHTITYIALKGALVNHKNVSFIIPKTPYVYTKILGHNFFITHGDTVITPGNVGKTINSENIKNKINDLKDSLGPIDVIMMGHVHVATHQILNNSTHLVVNGCMSGVDGFAQSIGILHSIPVQQLFEVTEKAAVGDMRFVRLAEADKQKELDLIITPHVGKF